MTRFAHWPSRDRVLGIGAASLYACALFGALFILGTAPADVLSAQRDLAAAQERLDAVARRSAATASPPVVTDLPAAAAFLSGEKLSLAGADLQKRVAAAISAQGGSVISSQLDRGETRGAASSLELAVECELPQSGLQALLYELEATTPLLFVESISIRTRADQAAGQLDPRLRVTLRLQGTWREPTT